MTEFDILKLKSEEIRCQYPETYLKIQKYNENFVGDIDSFAQQRFNYLNNILTRPVCKQCSGKVRFENFKVGYKKFCGNICAGIFKKNLSLIEKNEILKKRKKTNLEKYGVDNPAKSDIIKQKTLKTVLEKYGAVSPLLNKDINEKRQKTFLKNYGHHPLKDNELIKIRSEKRKNTMNLQWINSIKNKYPEFDFIDFNFDQRSVAFICQKCNKKSTLLNYVLYQRALRNDIICIECNPLDNTKTSQGQREIIQYVQSLEINFTTNEKEILNGKHIDILINELKVGIEFNGVYWHNEIYKHEKYHQDKFLASLSKDIKLVQIWQDDWQNEIKRNIIKSRLKNLLNINDNIIYARKCVIRDITQNEANFFFENNHLQGSVNSKYRIGLFYNNQLVSAMLLSKPRVAMNSVTKNDDEFELLRFCNILNTSVVGSASKLFNFFIQNIKPKKVISYADLDWGRGNFYEKLGFVFEKYTAPGYWYVINGVRQYRYNWRKDKLVKMGYDKNKTEQEIMTELGYYRVYGSGNAKWVYKK